MEPLMIRSQIGRACIAISAIFVFCLFSGTGICAAEEELDASRYSDRWLYCSFNLQVDHSVGELTTLFDRAKGSGYTGILFSDYKLQVLDRVNRTTMALS